MFINTGVYNVQSSQPTHGTMGIITPANNNAAFTLLRNTHHITVTGKHGFSIGQLNIENSGPGQTDARNEWQKVAHDINDPKKFGIADITYWVVEGNVGMSEKFTMNGGATIRARRIGQALPLK